MFELFGKLRYSEKNDSLLPGDIICVKRRKDFYRHYGIYIGRGRIVHYSSTHGEFDRHEDSTVHISSLEEFLRKEKTYYRVEIREGKGYTLFSPEETVERALSRLGEKSYSILTNNCEHFAMWCKTGISESCQIEKCIGEAFLMVPMMAMSLFLPVGTAGLAITIHSVPRAF